MMWNYLTFDFGQSYFRDGSVLRPDPREDAGVDLARPVADADPYLVSIPLGIRKAVQRRLAASTSGPRPSSSSAMPSRLPLRHPADRAVCRRQLFQLVPVARADLRQFRAAELCGKIARLCLAPRAAAASPWARLLRHHDAADQELVPRRDPQAICDDRARQGPDRAPGALRPRVPQRHADRDRRAFPAPSSAPSSPARC